jgi:hypothetical protein
MSEEERQKMLPEPEIDKDIDEAAPNYYQYTIHPNHIGAWKQGAQWERNRPKGQPCAYQVVRDRYKKLVDEISTVQDDISLIKVLKKMKDQIEFDEDCAFHGH